MIRVFNSIIGVGIIESAESIAQKYNFFFKLPKLFSIIFLHRYPHRRLLPPPYEGKGTSV